MTGLFDAAFSYVLQADVYAGFNGLYEAPRSGGSLIKAFRRAHTIRTQSNGSGRVGVSSGVAQWDEMLDLQALVVNDDTLDYQLMDGLPVCDPCKSAIPASWSRPR